VFVPHSGRSAGGALGGTPGSASRSSRCRTPRPAAGAGRRRSPSGGTAVVLSPGPPDVFACPGALVSGLSRRLERFSASASSRAPTPPDGFRPRPDGRMGPHRGRAGSSRYSSPGTAPTRCWAGTTPGPWLAGPARPRPVQQAPAPQPSATGPADGRAVDDGQAGGDGGVGPRLGAERGSCRWSQNRRSWQSPPSSRAIERLAPAGGASIPAHDNPDSHTSSVGPARHADVARIQEPDPAADTGLVESGDSHQLANVTGGLPRPDPQPCPRLRPTGKVTRPGTNAKPRTRGVRVRGHSHELRS
jgi:hypothetical protein